MLAQLWDLGAMKYEPATSRAAETMSPMMLSVLPGFRIAHRPFSVALAAVGVCALALKLHGELHYAAGAESGRSEGDEVLCILER